MPNLGSPRRLAQLFHVSAAAGLVYEHLARHGSLTATEAAALMGKSRSRAYEVLRELVAKGLAIEEPGRPTRFHVGNVREALATLREDLEEQSSDVDQALKLVPATPRQEVDSASPQVAFFYGLEALGQEAGRIARRAKHDLVFYCAGAEPLARSEPLLAGLRKAVRKGVRVRVYASPGTETANLLANLSVAPGKGFRGKAVGGLVPFSCLASESKVLLPLPDSPARGGKIHAIRLEGSAMSKLTMRTLEHMVSDAENEGEAVDAIDDFIPRYVQALDAAQLDVSNIGGAGFSRFLRPPYYRIFQAHSERAASRGVNLRAIVNDAPAELDFLRKYGTSADWQVRTAPWIPVWTSVIDRKHLFQALLGPDGPLKFRWSQGATEVDFHLRLFEATWKSAAPFQAPASGRPGVLIEAGLDE